MLFQLPFVKIFFGMMYFSDFFLKMDTDAGNESSFNAISEPVVATDDMPMNNNVVEADVKAVDSNEGGVNVQDASNRESSANGGVPEERPMSKREQKRALKRKVEQRGSTSQKRQDAKLFLQSSELRLPHPLTRRRVCISLLWFWREGHTRLRERGWES
jgi:hypothetical protein